MGKFMNCEEIRAALPNCGSLVLLDRAEIEATKGVALKNVTQNELFFIGHFPNHPIMPGVLQLEAMRQLCELIAAPELNPGNKAQIYLKCAEKVKFRKPNLPGDRIKLEAEEMERTEDTRKYKVSLSNASGLASEAMVTLGLRPVGQGSAMPSLFNEFDNCAGVAMDCNKTMSLMPHRFPFLLIDYLAKSDGPHLTAVKNVSLNEPFFTGAPHPVMPESVLCEIAAQSGCASVLSRPENTGKLAIFLAIDRAESLAPVYPGDQLVVDCVLPPAKGRFGKGDCRLLVEGKEVFLVNLTFAVVEA